MPVRDCAYKMSLTTLWVVIWCVCCASETSDKECSNADASNKDIFDVKQWLSDNKLEKYAKIFKKENLTIEELLTVKKLYKTENEFSNEYLFPQLGIVNKLDIARFILALNRTEMAAKAIKDNYKILKGKPANDNSKRESEPTVIIISAEEQSNIDKLEKRKQSTETAIVELNHNIDSLMDNQMKCVIDIDSTFDDLIIAVNKRRRFLIEKSEQITLAKMKALSNQLRQLYAYNRSIESSLIQINDLFKIKNKSLNRTQRSIDITQRTDALMNNSVSLIAIVSDIVEFQWETLNIDDFGNIVVSDPSYIKDAYRMYQNSNSKLKTFYQQYFG